MNDFIVISLGSPPGEFRTILSSIGDHLGLQTEKPALMETADDAKGHMCPPACPKGDSPSRGGAGSLLSALPKLTKSPKSARKHAAFRTPETSFDVGETVIFRLVWPCPRV